MAHLPARIAAMIGTTAIGFFLASGASTANAQQYGGNYPQTGTPSPVWYVYPGVNSWAGYPTTNPWAGYAPAVPAQPSTAYVQPPARAYVQPTPVAPGYVYNVPTQATVAVPRAAAPRRVQPAYYRELGTGRNVFLHKPWLPGGR